MVELISKEHHVDCDEPDSDGMHEYYYAYWDYELKSGQTRFKVRSYDDEHGRFIFMSYSMKGDHNRSFDHIPYEDRDFCDAVVYMVENEGAVRVELMASGCAKNEVVDVRRLSVKH